MNNQFYRSVMRQSIIMLVFSLAMLVFTFSIDSSAFAQEETQASACNIEENLIVNGSFETPILTDSGWDVFESEVNGLMWNVSWVNPVLAPSIALLEIQNGYDARNGSEFQYAELDSNWYKAPGQLVYEGEDTSVIIKQTIPTIVGATYTINWSFSPLPGYDLTDNVLEVLVAGAIVDTNSADGLTIDNINWVDDSYTFVANATSTEIAFRDAGVPINSFGTLLDEVSAHCVSLPEVVIEDVVVQEEKKSSSSSGTRTNRFSKTPAPQVLGTTTTAVPTKSILGEQVTVVPVGAPDTGAGGTSGGVLTLNQILLGLRRSNLV